jgi:NTE family protein
VVKRYYTVFVSDGGAPFGRTSELDTDWISQLRRILDVTDNQVRALRRRDLIGRFIDGNKVGDETKLQAAKAYGRLGAYWGIDTDPAKLTPPNSLPVNPAVADRLAQTKTRLADPGARTAKELINWGYAICDRSLRANYAGPILSVAPAWPYPEAPLT